MKKRVLFILHLPPPVHGAAMVGQFIRESKTINERYDCRYINYTTASSLQDIGGRGFVKLKRIFKIYGEVIETIETFKPDLVYITPNSKGGAFYFKDVPIVTYIKLRGIKILAHYHNKGVALYQRRIIDNYLYKHFFYRIKVILLAEELYPDIKKYVNREDVCICPNGIPVTNSITSSKNANRDVSILFLSNLLINKGVLTLLDALKLLNDSGKHFVCNFVGGETAEMDAKCFAEEVRKRGLDNRVCYKGRLFGEAKEAIFIASDIFVLPSFDEAFPLVNLEAMSYGLPVISTNVGGIPSEIVNGVNGLLCEPRDVEGLFNCIAKLIDDGVLRNVFGKNGFKRYSSNFTICSFIDRFVEIIDNEIKG